MKYSTGRPVPVQVQAPSVASYEQRSVPDNRPEVVACSPLLAEFQSETQPMGSSLTLVITKPSPSWGLAISTRPTFINHESIATLTAARPLMIKRAGSTWPKVPQNNAGRG